jgi:CRISPR/Cas system CMR-associated protein Cmr5 small subunit
MEENAPEAVIEPKDKATIKYLSNVKDANTGEISKPFTIGDKRYQMVRGQHPTDGIVMGVYCFDELNENGENIIHPVDYFEKTVALPYKQKMEEGGGFDYAAAERQYHDQENLMNYLNLGDVEAGAKHFFVDTTNGNIVSQFKNTKEMVKSGVKLGPNQDYMDLKTLKKFRFGEYFKKEVSEELKPEDAGTNLPKLQSDVKRLVAAIKNKFSQYLSKLDKPVEQAQFLSTMAQEIGVPINKLSTIINTYKDIAKDGDVDTQNMSGVKAESKVITKKDLEESINKKPVIKIKVKDIKHE